MSNHAVAFCVSREMIAQALAMPEGSVIRSIWQSDRIPSVYLFIVEHPDLPEVQEGNLIPETHPILTADYEKRPATWLTWDWGLTTK